MKLITESGHFWLEFENGYTLSVFNGYGSYTENHFNFDKFKKIIDTKDIYASWESEKVEIAILYNDEMVTNNILQSGDSVTTIAVSELPELINKLANIKE